MKLAVIGSREYPNMDLVTEFVLALASKEKLVIVSGGARGVDLAAETAAKSAGVETDIYPADWDNLGKKAGYVRNTAMSKVVDRCVAFWDLKSRGSKHMINECLKRGVPVTIFPPNVGKLIYDGV